MNAGDAAGIGGLGKAVVSFIHAYLRRQEADQPAARAEEANRNAAAALQEAAEAQGSVAAAQERSADAQEYDSLTVMQAVDVDRETGGAARAPASHCPHIGGADALRLRESFMPTESTS